MAEQPRVMIVDDDPDLADLLEAALEDEYETVSVYNGHEALARVNEYEPDLFIVDIMMPVLSGWEVIERLRADVRHRDKPIVVLTAKDERSDMRKGYELGANLYLTKPVSIDRLHRNLEVFQRSDEIKVGFKTLSIEEARALAARRRREQR